MINKVQFSILNNTHCKRPLTQPLFKQKMPNDTIEISNENREKAALEKARNHVLSTMEERNTECGLIVNPQGEIADMFKIPSKNYFEHFEKLAPNSTIILGRSTNNPLTPKNVAHFLSSDAKSIEVITKDGQFSRLTKNDKKVKLKNPRNAAKELTLQLYSKAAKEAGIDLKPTKEDLMTLARDYIYNVTGKDLYNSPDEEVLQELSNRGIKPSEDVPLTYKQLTKASKNYIFYLSTTKYKKILHKEIEISKFLSTEEGFKVKQDFLQGIAEKYNLTYESNMN